MGSNLARIRKLCASMRHREAEQLLLPLIQLQPDDPALLLALAEVLCYTGREVEAVWALDRTSERGRWPELLATHFAGRLALDPNDAEARSCYEQLGVEAKAQIAVSACLIVKNESKNLDRCLSSLRGFVQEIIVVDTGSTDDTVQIAQSHGAKVDSFAWCDDFAAARNHALTKATGDWILIIDADEELEPESQAFMKQAIVRPHFGGFNAEIVNFTDDSCANSTYLHQAVRLFRNSPNIRFEGRIHEQITPSLEAAKLPWANLPGFRILHYGYRPSVMAERNKMARTVKALEKEVRDQPADPFNWFNLANAYIVGSRWPEAEHAARMCARHSPDRYEYGALNYQFLATALSNQSKHVEALRACDEAESRGHGGLFIEFERANVLFRVGNFEKALLAATRCCEASWPANSIGDRTIFDSKRWVLKGQILALLNRHQEALADFERAGEHPVALYSRAATLERAGDPVAALEAFLEGQDRAEIRQVCLKGAGRCAMTLGLPKQAAAFFRQAWEANPADYESWCSWAHACETWGDLPSILAAYEAYVAESEPSAQILINWGRALELAGSTERALACYTEAIQRDPNDANAFFNAGDLLYKMDQFQDAAHLYQTGLRLRPDHAEGWFVLGNTLFRLGIVEGARIGYEQTLLLDPTHEAARSNLDVVAESAA